MSTNQRIASWLRHGRDAGAWRPSHAKLLLDQTIDRGRNERLGHTDSDHLHAAAAWLERAQDATGNGGIAGRYRLQSGWTSAYPETTGYIIPTFLSLADEPAGLRFRARAQAAVEFLLALQLEGGGFPGGEIDTNTAEPSFFNTGQIIAGLTAWYRATGDARSIQAACRAADWLVGLQESDGTFRRHLYRGLVTTYGAHASCWLAELGREVRSPRYLDAARRHMEWVVAQQDRATGWIDLAGFTESDHGARRSVTHTIAYTLYGLLFTAEVLGDTGALAAVERAAIAIARRVELSGYLPGVLDHRWRAAATFSCLTGNAQMALVWLALFDRTGDSRFLNAALKAIDLVKRAQPMSSSDPGIRGGIPGSDPVWGDYIRMAVPNWAAKFFIDALLKKRAVLSDVSLGRTVFASAPAFVRQNLPQPPAIGSNASVRMVMLASPTSAKVARLIRAGVRPVAVVVLSKQAPKPTERIWQGLRQHGIASVLRRGRSGPRASSDAATPSARGSVRTWCRDAGIEVVEVDSFDSPGALEAIRALRPDLFVFAGGAILRAPLLAIPRLGTLNAHMGLLPFYRGMNVAEWACLHGDSVGCTVHLIDPGIDTGDVLCHRLAPIDDARSVAAVRETVDDAQIALLTEVINYIASTGALPPRRAQSATEGRQFFRMHPALLQVLESRLASGGLQPARVAEQPAVAERAVAAAMGSRR